MTDKQPGLLHVYCGDGKGKTTASMGLLLRALGNGYKAVVVQFLKDGSSGEMKMLRALPDVEVFTAGFGAFGMTEKEKGVCREEYAENFRQAVAICEKDSRSLLVLDEAAGAIRRGLFDEELLLDWLKNRPPGVEVVITGRRPSERLLELADYVSRIEKIKHPYDKGIPARLGVEK